MHHKEPAKQMTSFTTRKEKCSSAATHSTCQLSPDLLAYQLRKYKYKYMCMYMFVYLSPLPSKTCRMSTGRLPANTLFLQQLSHCHRRDVSVRPLYLMKGVLRLHPACSGRYLHQQRYCVSCFMSGQCSESESCSSQTGEDNETDGAVSVYTEVVHSTLSLWDLFHQSLGAKGGEGRGNSGHRPRVTRNRDTVSRVQKRCEVEQM